MRFETEQTTAGPAPEPRVRRGLLQVIGSLVFAPFALLAIVRSRLQSVYGDSEEDLVFRDARPGLLSDLQRSALFDTSTVTPLPSQLLAEKGLLQTPAIESLGFDGPNTLRAERIIDSIFGEGT